MSGSLEQSLEGFARLDLERERRTGLPEVVLAEGKPLAEVAGSCERLLTETGHALVSRLEISAGRTLEERIAGFTYHERARLGVARAPGHAPPEGGTVGVLAAGSSDARVADEAALCAGEAGATVQRAYDLGVAGLHRLAEPLRGMLDAGAGALVVAAGMEGALPSVVCGLVDVPVIGLPVSTGYGYGGRGEAALMGMLQSCAPGLVTVNIDDGVGAGLAAALIARRR